LEDTLAYPNPAAFKQACKDIKSGTELTVEMVGSVFGPDFYCMVIYLLLDSNDAARAIQGAVNRLKEGGKEDLE
jgi:hypothetical protein